MKHPTPLTSKSFFKFRSQRRNVSLKRTNPNRNARLDDYEFWQVMIALFACGKYEPTAILLNIGGGITSFSHYLSGKQLKRQQIIAISTMAGVSLEQVEAHYDQLIATDKGLQLTRDKFSDLRHYYCAMLQGKDETISQEMIDKLRLLAAICKSKTEQEAANLLGISESLFLECLTLAMLDYATISQQYLAYKEKFLQIQLTPKTQKMNRFLDGINRLVSIPSRANEAAVEIDDSNETEAGLDKSTENTFNLQSFGS